MKVLYYFTSGGRNPVRSFIEEQHKVLQAEIVDAISMLEDEKTLQMPLSRSLPDIHKGLHELRFKDRAGESRIVYYVKKKEAIYLVHAFKKKTRTMSKKDKALILKRLKEI